eukprot:jgi/Botrbrau1/4803/Bobra.0325s0025.1
MLRSGSAVARLWAARGPVMEARILQGTAQGFQTTHTSAAPAASANVSVAEAQPALTAGGAGVEGTISGWRKFAGVAGAVAAFAVGASVSLAEEEADHGLHAPHYPWPHDGFFSSYDHAAIRRGHQVYQQVCAACHSVNQLYFPKLGWGGLHGGRSQGDGGRAGGYRWPQ